MRLSFRAEPKPVAFAFTLFFFGFDLASDFTMAPPALDRARKSNRRFRQVQAVCRFGKFCGGFVWRSIGGSIATPLRRVARFFAHVVRHTPARRSRSVTMSRGLYSWCEPAPLRAFAVIYTTARAHSELQVRFLSHRHATIAKQVLEVDQELQPDRQAKTMQIDGSILRVSFLELAQGRQTRVLSSPHSRAGY